MKCKHLNKTERWFGYTTCLDCFQSMISVERQYRYLDNKFVFTVQFQGYKRVDFQRFQAAIIFATYVGKVGPEKVMVKL